MVPMVDFLLFFLDLPGLVGNDPDSSSNFALFEAFLVLEYTVEEYDFQASASMEQCVKTKNLNILEEVLEEMKYKALG